MRDCQLAVVVRALFVAFWEWQLLSGEKPVTSMGVRCERSKCTLLLDRLVVDRETLAESDRPARRSDGKAARNRALRTHRLRVRCLSVRYVCS